MATGNYDFTAYNQIKRFENQVNSITPDLLKGLGEIFVRHGEHGQYGASILHRHHELLPGMMMVRSKRNARIDTCCMVPMFSAAPSALYLHPTNGFQPFEHDRDFMAKAPKQTFLEELRSFLHHRNLEDVVAISKIPVGDNDHWVEYLLANGTGTISYRLEEAEFNAEDGEVTAWRFENDTGKIIHKARIKCKDAPSGGHTRDDNGHVREAF